MVYVTVAEKDAEALARALVETRLSACVNVVPQVRSFYRWEGAVQADQEALLIMKTRSSAFDALRDRVVALHPYDLPEVIACEVVHGHEPYLEWVRAEVERP